MPSSIIAKDIYHITWWCQTHSEFRYESVHKDLVPFMIVDIHDVTGNKVTEVLT